MNIKDELRIMVKYLLEPEESKEVDVVENYVDTFYLIFEEYQKQLALCNVSCSLPSKEAVTLEAYKQAEEMKKQNDKVDKFAYSCGYIDGYEKCKSLFETE